MTKTQRFQTMRCLELTMEMSERKHQVEVETETLVRHFVLEKVDNEVALNFVYYQRPYEMMLNIESREQRRLQKIRGKLR